MNNAIQKKLMRLLAKREYSRFRLYQKLTTQGFCAKEVDEALAWCIAHNMQSDARFAENFVLMRYRQGYGPERIYAELQQHQISHNEVSAFINDAQFDWSECLTQQLQKKINMGVCDVLKLKRYVYQRGFSATLIEKVLPALMPYINQHKNQCT